jgi:soluble lytic murein transglycosylase-like protein
MDRFDGLFWLAALRWAPGTGLDTATFAALLKAHAQAESNFDPAVVGPEATIVSRGLMQLTERTARALGYTGPLGDDTMRTGGLYEPATAVPLAAALVHENLVGAGGNVNAAIAAYNEGLPRALADAAAGMPWRTYDPAYVPKVRANLDRYLPALQALSATEQAALAAKGAL